MACSAKHTSRASIALATSAPGSSPFHTRGDISAKLTLPVGSFTSWPRTTMRSRVLYPIAGRR